MTRNSQFQRGSGAYRCNICSRMTRETGNGKGPCAQCYELAGYENMVQDGTEASDISADVAQLIASLRDKGGTVDAWDSLMTACKLTGGA